MPECQQQLDPRQVQTTGGGAFEVQFDTSSGMMGLVTQVSTGIISALASVTYLGFLIYALVSASSYAPVAAACGWRLWNLMLARIVLYSVGIIGWACIAGVFAAVIGWRNDNAGLAGATCIALLFIIQIIVIFALEAKFAVDAAQNDSCVSALTSASFTKSPLLLYIAYVEMAFDGLFLFTLMIAALFIGCAMAI